MSNRSGASELAYTGSSELWLGVGIIVAIGLIGAGVVLVKGRKR